MHTLRCRHTTTKYLRDYGGQMLIRVCTVNTNQIGCKSTSAARTNSARYVVLFR